MYLIRDLLDGAAELPLKTAMAASNKPSSPQHPDFFIIQSEKLTALLNVVVHEAESATNPDALVDYLELNAILTELLEKAQLFAAFTDEELQSKDQDVRSFLDKMQTVQDAVGDWDARTKVSMPTSRKRARSIDLDEPSMVVLKRQKEIESDCDDAAYGSTGLPVPSVLPSIESSPTPWWTEPFCD